MIKKITSVLIALTILVLTILPMNLSAAVEGIMIMTSAEAKPGEKVVIEVSIDNNPGFAGVQLEIGYDSNALTSTKRTINKSIIDVGSGVATCTNKAIRDKVTNEITGYKIVLAAAALDDDGNLVEMTGNGRILNLEFEVSNDAKPGKYDFTIIKQKFDDKDENPLAFKATVGSITVLCDHELSDWQTDDANHWHICTKCGAKLDESAHEWGEPVVTKPATCTEKGEKTYTCTVCEYTKTEDTPELGHEFEEEWSYDDEDHWHDCKNGCGLKNDKAAHSLNEVIDKVPTEEEAGEKHYECTVCDYKSAGVVIDPLPHEHDMEHHEAKAATCVEEGNLEYWHCVKCGRNYADSIGTTEIADVSLPLDPDNHIGDTEVRGVKEATCCEEGYTGDVYCLACGEVVEPGEATPIDPDNHAGETEVRNEKNATCCKEGYTGDTYCLACGEIVEHGEVTPIDPDNHAGETEVRGAKEATCCERGYTGNTYCLDCGKMIEEGSILAIDPNNHVGGTEVRGAKEATCCEEGYTGDTYCLSCGEKIADGEATPIDPDNHAGGTEVRGAKEATCCEEGSTGDTYCLGCGKILVNQEVISPLGHTISEWIVKTPATTYSEGEKIKVCTSCGELLDSEKLEKLGSVISSESSNGSVNVTVVDAAAMNAKLSDVSSLIDSIISIDDQTAIANGASVETALRLTNIDNVSASDKSAIGRVLPQGYTVGTYMDISIIKTIGGESVAVSSVDGGVEIVVSIPNDIYFSNRNYSVIRVHDGVATIINSNYDSYTCQLSFRSDKFSTYAIVYNSADEHITGIVYLNDSLHIVVRGDSRIPMPHTDDIFGVRTDGISTWHVCSVCGHIFGKTDIVASDDAIESVPVIDVDTPTESGDNAEDIEVNDSVNVTDDAPKQETNPGTGVVFSVIPMLIAAAVIAARKR